MTLEELQAALSYDPAAGSFVWKVAKRGHARPGDVAGYSDRRGYVYIKIGQTRYMAHRLAWFNVHGVWPANEIDHVNGNPSDNRLSNLREATHGENSRNCKTRAHSASGVKGVSLHKGKWRAQITADGKLRHLGYFPTPEAAHVAYCAAAEKLHGAFARAA